MMLIDAHAHLMAEPDYVDGLLRTMDREGIAQTCVSGLGELFGMADNQGTNGVAFLDQVYANTTSPLMAGKCR